MGWRSTGGRRGALRLVSVLVGITVLLGTVPAVRADTSPGDVPADLIGPTPPRLSYVDGEVMFWRPGAEDWTPATLNTPLAAGDLLSTGHRGNVEFQVDTQAFVRAWGDTELGLLTNEIGTVQIALTTGHAVLDLRSLEPGRRLELQTPHGALAVDGAGYYRADVAPERTVFTVRRGQAGASVGGGPSVVIATGDALILDGQPEPTVQRVAAPAPDVWDRWNDARTAALVRTASAQHVPSGVYGVAELDHHGDWRQVPAYGSVWVPRAVPSGWVPYSTGRWIWDPFYGWTWVDTAPWGWAPYHHGRWVFVDGFWGWAPGPVIARPVYAPALVAFFGARGPHIDIRLGLPFVSWVALGWGEPVVPWWGRSRFVGRPSWIGWGGPRIVNNVVVKNTTVVNVTPVVYRNVSVRNAVVAVPRDRFGRDRVHETRVSAVDVSRLRPIAGSLPVTRDPGRQSPPPVRVGSVDRPRPAGFATPGSRIERPERRLSGEAPTARTPRPAGAIPPLTSREPIRAREESRVPSIGVPGRDTIRPPAAPTGRWGDRGTISPPGRDVTPGSASVPRSRVEPPAAIRREMGGTPTPPGMADRARPTGPIPAPVVPRGDGPRGPAVSPGPPARGADRATAIVPPVPAARANPTPVTPPARVRIPETGRVLKDRPAPGPRIQAPAATPRARPEVSAPSPRPAAGSPGVVPGLRGRSADRPAAASRPGPSRAQERRPSPR